MRKSNVKQVTKNENENAFQRKVSIKSIIYNMFYESGSANVC